MPSSTDDSDEKKTTDTPLQRGLEKSRGGLMTKLRDVFQTSFKADETLFEELEDALISADIGVQASDHLVQALRQQLKQLSVSGPEDVVQQLRASAAELLTSAEQPWTLTSKPVESPPYVLMLVGVNGAGKTTTIAKLSALLNAQGLSVMLAAADTFRAAAVEQIKHWGQRLNIPVIAQQHGADAAAVAHDALTAAKARDVDVLLIDTAGRLHTQADLMQQLEKVHRVIAKQIPDAPHEVMQIIDAGTGQNALQQLQQFQQAVGVNSVCLTKLDGTSRGGVALALTQQFGLPIRFIGVGEGASDLRPFSAEKYAAAMLGALGSEQSTS